MAKRNINLINKKYRHMIADIDVEPSGLDVWLNRPYLFMASEASCTFMPFELFEDDEDAFASAVKAVNDELADTYKIDPKAWDEGRA
tara:strand:- start:8 stop:268 length:261 start_codon:yes stop_codon:yes gene_type:complete